MERGPTENSKSNAQASVGTRSAASTAPTERGPTEPSTLAGIIPPRERKTSHPRSGIFGWAGQGLRGPNRPCSTSNRSLILNLNLSPKSYLPSHGGSVASTFKNPRSPSGRVASHCSYPTGKLPGCGLLFTGVTDPLKAPARFVADRTTYVTPLRCR